MRITTRAKRKEQRRYPLPEISGDKWDIKQDRMGMVNMETKLMFVPLDATLESEFVRAHEVTHAKFSPIMPNAEELGDLSVMILKAVEDYRIHRLMKLAKITYDFGDTITGRFRFVETPMDIMSLYICCLGSPYETAMKAAIPESVKPEKDGNYLNQATKILVRHFGDRIDSDAIFSFTTTLECTRELQNLVTHAEHIAKLVEADDTLPEEMLESEIAELMKFHMPDGEDPDHKDVPWGRMDIMIYPMPIRCKSYLVRANVPVDEGVMMHDISRWSTDGKIFSKKKAVFGCTILMDLSGSMSLSRQDVYHVIEKAPHAKIMTYSANGESGTLRIIADKGKRVYDDDMGARDGGMNVIDFPALQYLSQQRAPRIWISDGHVTGIYDRSTPAMSLQCKEFALSHGIKRVPNIKKALDLLDYIKYNCKPGDLKRMSVGHFAISDGD